MKSKLLNIALALVVAGCGSDGGGKEQKPADKPKPVNNGANQNQGRRPVGGGDVGQNPATTEQVSVSPKLQILIDESKLNGRKVQIKRGNVQNSGMQVIVNAANEWMAIGSAGGSHASIVGDAGPKQIDEDVKNQKGRFFESMGGVDDKGGTDYILNPGEAMTTTAGNLNARGIKHIIHGVGPRFPGSGDITQQLQTLKRTYTSIFDEMKKLHQRDSSITSIAVMPISAGAFNGTDDNVPHIYDVMLVSVFEALMDNQWLKACISGAKYTILIDRAKALNLRKYVKDDSAPKKPALGMTAVSNFELMKAPVYHVSMGSESISGAATDVGAIRMMGGMIDSSDHKTSHLSLGCAENGSFLGAELETSWHQGELGHYALKALGIWSVSPSLTFNGGIGYVTENSAVGLSDNVRTFLHTLGVSSSDMMQSGAVFDLAGQWNIFSGDNVSLNMTVASRMVFVNELSYSLRLQSSLKVQDTNVMLGISSNEFAVALSHSQ